MLVCVQDNLRREQRAVMDLNCQLISKILTPLQVGPLHGTRSGSLPITQVVAAPVLGLGG